MRIFPCVFLKLNVDDCLVLRVCREAMLADMGVAVREDSTLVGVFSPKKVS
jgi:hypothetical protein